MLRISYNGALLGGIIWRNFATFSPCFFIFPVRNTCKIVILKSLVNFGMTLPVFTGTVVIVSRPGLAITDVVY